MIDIQKILLPIDFSKASTMLLPYALNLAHKYGARLFILYVAENPLTYSGLPSNVELFPDEYLEDMVPRARRKMARFVADNIGKLSLDVAEIILSGHPAEEIINYAAQEKMDLLVIGSHGYTGFEKLVFGSVAEKVVKMASCPVLTINTHQGD